MGIALWLSPPSSSPKFAALSDTLSTLSTTYSAPLFTPHLTLISSIPSSTPLSHILHTLRTAIQKWRTTHVPPLVVEFGALGTRGTYFQYVFAGVEKGEALRALRGEVRRGFFPEKKGEEDEGEYFPHLSLLYGEDTDGDDEGKNKGKTAEGVIQQLLLDGTARHTALPQAGAEGEAEEGAQQWSIAGVERFEVEEVTVVQCDGRPEEWKVLGTVRL